MTRKRFVITQMIWTPLFAAFFALVTGNPDWWWNIPLGLLVGLVGGVLLWPVVRRLQSWLDGKDAKRDKILNEREARRDGYVTGDRGGQP